MGFFSAKKTSYDPFSAYTPQQRASIEALMGLASTGTGGGITLGQGYGGDLGYYNQAPGELQSLEGLMGLINGGDITGARDTFSRLANNKFNPDDPSSGYASFSRALAKAGGESQDAINREAARTGGAFGSGRGRDTAGLQADLANQRGSFLANLFNQGENRALAGAQGLQGLVGTQQGLYGQIQEQAQIQRLLKDQQAKERYAEFQRARGEELSRIGLMQDERNNPMGVINTKTPSLFSQFASTALNSFGESLGSGIAGLATGGMSSLSGLFSKNMGGGGFSQFGNLYGFGTPNGVRDMGSYSRLR